jgi:LuxR family maltose regulon positive regulatory protein
MAFQVLSTKLYNPPLKPGLVRRPRLVQRLENGYQTGKLVTLVSAPAGFGKTTLISEWIAGTEGSKPFGWISLDDSDNDPIRFLTYLVTAIQKVHGEIGRSVLALLQSSQNTNLTDLVEALINEISSASKPFLIVLDDYHLIKNIEIHALMQVFLKQQPNLLHLVFITRVDPPLPLPRMRAQGQITEIRARDLRFNLLEAQAFLVEAMGIALSSDEVGKLTERTEGWAAGMQLAALALEEFQDDEGRRSFIEAFTGSDRLIVDYLISEVLQRQPDTTQQFLLSTSILDRFCAELSDTVVFNETNASRSQQILDSLEQGNMFMVPLDNQRRWYRYHHLFSEMLYHSLRRSSPDQIPALHRRASDWFEERGLIPEAVKHVIAYASASQDWDYAKSFLDRKAMQTLFQGQSSLVIEWCREFPQAFLEKAPEICIYFAWALVLTFREDYLDAVEEKLELAERAIEAGNLPLQAQVGQDGALVPLREWITGHICVIRSQILLGRFKTFIDPQELISLSLKGIKLLPQTEKASLAICKINLAHAQTMQNNPAEAQKAFEEALPFMLEAHNYLTSVTAIFYQARLAFYLGQLDRAEALCREWKVKFAEMAGGTTRDSKDIPATRGLDIVLSLLLMERNQLEDAERLLVQSLELLGWASWMELHGFIVLAHLRFLRGNDSGVQDTLRRMARMGPQHAACADALQVLFEVKRSPNDPQVRFKAETWAKKFAPHPVEQFALGIGPYHCDAEYFCNLAWARVQIALGHPQDAFIFIGPALESARKHNLLFRIVELSIAQTLIMDGLGNHSAALDELRKALEIAERVGYARVFDDGVRLDKLLTQEAERGLHSQYVRQLLDSFNRTSAMEKIDRPASHIEKGQGELVEPLSERELEVLRLLAKGLSPANVAKHLVVSPNTLKAHTQNIYSKMDVHSRIEAINKARELGLI